METEIKLAFNSKEELMAVINAEWFGDYCLDAVEKAPVKLTNTYYDTKDRILKAKGTSVRVRLYEDEDGERYEHTVKFGGSVVNGLHQRYEWNVDSEDDSFDVDSFKAASVRNDDDPSEILEDALGDIKNEDLVALCSTYCERTTYTFGFGDSIMEACFDIGVISAGNKKEDICELELELESGDVVDLKDMAQFIIDSTDARLFDDSKYIRALRLLDKADEE
ncbi:MAG: CYTH domain-containing protein [Saccharofermentans sp.]|nr:CYTH domain-containing protein [Saccharofermentans sp.]